MEQWFRFQKQTPSPQTKVQLLGQATQSQTRAETMKYECVRLRVRVSVLLNPVSSSGCFLHGSRDGETSSPVECLLYIVLGPHSRLGWYLGYLSVGMWTGRVFMFGSVLGPLLEV